MSFDGRASYSDSDTGDRFAMADDGLGPRVVVGDSDDVFGGGGGGSRGTHHHTRFDVGVGGASSSDDDDDDVLAGGGGGANYSDTIVDADSGSFSSPSSRRQTPPPVSQRRRIAVLAGVVALVALVMVILVSSLAAVRPGGQVDTPPPPPPPSPPSSPSPSAPPPELLTVLRVARTQQLFAGRHYAALALVGSGPRWVAGNASSSQQSNGVESGAGWAGGVGGLLARVGDRLALDYRNELPADPNATIPGLGGSEMTIIHQHGMTPPLAMDGMPFLSYSPIAPGAAAPHVEFPLEEHNVGTYFVHGHYGLQHSLGLSAPLMVLPRQGEGAPADFPMKQELDSALDVMFNIRDFCPSFGGDAADGSPAADFTGERREAWRRQAANANCDDPAGVFAAMRDAWVAEQPFNLKECMTPGSGSDIAFRGHLVNDQALADVTRSVEVQRNQWVRLRFINDASMSEYELRLAPGLTGTVVATDGQYTTASYSSDTFYIAVAQRLDVLVRIPDAAGSWGITAVGSETTQQAGLVLTTPGFTPATLSAVASTPAPDVGAGAYTAMERQLHALRPLTPQTPDVTFDVNLTGDNGFKGINEQAWRLPPVETAFAPNPAPLVVQPNQRVCMKFRNFNADEHAMHLHGHLFQVTEMNGETLTNGPMRETFLVQRGGCWTATVCFNADNPGRWFMHCHLSFHLAAGMLTSIEYAQ